MSVKTTTVRHLKPGMVMSMPDIELAPSVVQVLATTVPEMRSIVLTDLYTGQPHGATMMLNLDRAVLVHDVEAELHFYTNESSEVQEVRLGNQWYSAEPTETLHFPGVARPDKFPEPQWSHRAEPFEVSSDEDPL